MVLQAAVGNAFAVRRRLRHALRWQFVAGHRDIGQLGLAGHLRPQQHEADATHFLHPVGGRHLLADIGSDAAAQERIAGAAGEDDDIALLRADRAGGAEIQPIEQAAEEQQQRGKERQHDGGHDEPARPAAQLAQWQHGQAHSAIPAPVVADNGSRRRTRRTATNDVSSASARTTTEVMTAGIISTWMPRFETPWMAPA